MKDLMAGLAILAKYNADAETCAMHDILLVQVPKDNVSQEDQDKLESLGGWHWSSESDSWGFFT